MRSQVLRKQFINVILDEYLLNFVSIQRTIKLRLLLLLLFIHQLVAFFITFLFLTSFLVIFSFFLRVCASRLLERCNFTDVLWSQFLALTPHHLEAFVKIIHGDYKGFTYCF